MDMYSGISKRLTVVIVVVVVVLIAAGLAGIRGFTDEHRAVRGLGSAALSRGTDPGAMPALMTAKAKSALAPHVPPGQVKFFAGNARYEQVPAGSLDTASYMYTDLGDTSTHSWRLYVAKVSDSPIGNTNNVGACDLSTARGTTIECDISLAPDGTRTLIFVTATVYDAMLENYMLVDYRTITADQMPSVRLQRYVEVTHPDGSETSVSETVLGPTALSLDQFSASIAQATTLATDPALQLEDK